MVQGLQLNKQQGIMTRVESAPAYLAKTSRSLESRRVGVEIELQVLNSTFEEVNRADEIIALAQQQGLHVVAECSKSMIELISSPDSAKNVARELAKSYILLSHLAESIGLVVLPLDYPLNTLFVPEIRMTPKLKIKREMIGADYDYAGLVCGMHMHFDLDGTPTDNLRANFLKLIEPITASLTSTTMHEYKGMHIQNWRLFAYQSIVHKDYKHHGGLSPLTASFDDYIIQMHELTESFKASYQGKELIDEVIAPYMGIWGSLRFKPDIQTIELRSPGAVPDFVYLDLYTQFMDRFNVLLSTKEIDFSLFLNLLFETEDLSLAFDTLESLAVESIIYGLKSKKVQSYCHSFLEFFNDVELQNLFQDIVERKKIRDFISCSDHMSSSEKYSLLYGLSQESAHTISKQQ